MCDYCRKFTQKAYSFKEGYDVNTGYGGEAFIDLFNNLIVHLEGKDSIEVSIPVKYCPWCGRELEDVAFEESKPSKSCSYAIENGTQPCCTHECNGCMWYV